MLDTYSVVGNTQEAAKSANAAIGRKLVYGEHRSHLQYRLHKLSGAHLYS